MKFNAEKLILLRTAQGWYQEDLARRAGLSPSYISQIESGHKDPSPVALKAIAGALMVSVVTLYSEAVPSTCPHCGEAIEIIVRRPT